MVATSQIYECVDQNDATGYFGRIKLMEHFSVKSMEPTLSQGFHSALPIMW
jgi:hypothetical protein